MAQPTPCGDIGHSEFDFWVGQWELSWPAEQMGGAPGDRGRGRNHIERVLNDCVIEENFSLDDGSFGGHSVSVFDANSGMWRQTWVDSSAGYIVLSGMFQDGKMILSTEPRERDGQSLINRMVFRDITWDSLRWDWQGSRDGGETWTDLWNIEYDRIDG